MRLTPAGTNERPVPGLTDRRGTALVMTLMMTMTMAALALSAIYLSSNAALLSRFYSRERDFRYAAEAALAMGKSRLNTDANALPDTGYVALMTSAPIVGADGKPLTGVTVNVFAGKTGSTSGQFGSFASVIAEARDAQGARFVRRLELNQESFAKFAYWTDKETNNGNVIFFGNGDNLWGPVWSNDVISISPTRAAFHDVVGTARTISGVNNATYDKGYNINQRRIELPDNSKLASLPAYAALGNLSFNAPTNGSETTVNMRIEFVAADLNGDGDATDADEGFIRVYQGAAGNAAWTRGDYPTNAANGLNCGDWHNINGVARFFPAAIHNTDWFRAAIRTMNGGTFATAAAATTESQLTLSQIMQHANARCFPGGDPHLVAVERNSGAFTPAQKQIGGSPTTFTGTGRYGTWRPWPGPVDPRLAARPDAGFLFPLHRLVNSGSKGVIYVNGTVGVSGTVRSKITLYSNANVVILDDLRYATDPASILSRCADMLGIIADRDIIIANNAILAPPEVAANRWINVDDTKDLYVHGVLMALRTSFRVEDYDSGPSNANGCEGSVSGRGCLYLTGGIIQERRGAVGQISGMGYVKRYSYDRCAAANPPPYFPTTGRFEDNRYYEIDPVRFDVAKMFAALTPS